MILQRSLHINSVYKTAVLQYLAIICIIPAASLLILAYPDIASSSASSDAGYDAWLQYGWPLLAEYYPGMHYALVHQHSYGGALMRSYFDALM